MLVVQLPLEFVTPTVSVPEQASLSLIISALELVALMLPALAIILQVSFTQSQEPEFELTGDGEELRTISFLGLGIAGMLLTGAMSLLISLLDVSELLRVALILILLTMVIFTGIPLSVGLYRRQSNLQSNQLIELVDYYERAHALEKFDEGALRIIGKHLENDEEAFLTNEPENDTRPTCEPNDVDEAETSAPKIPM